MALHFSRNVKELQPSATLAVGALAGELRARGRDVIDLSAGEPDFATPEFIRRAGMAAIEKGFTHYTPVPGIPALREAIADHLGRRSGVTVDARGIVVSAGAKQALFNVCFVLFGPGDRVIVPAPYWTSYPALLQLARAEPVIVAGPETNGFKLSPDHLDAAYGPDVRGLILNSPCNPTGAVYTAAELEALAGWAAERGVWLISDEIYGRLCYTRDLAPGILDLDPALLERVVLIDGASKVFAMTGWRIGFSHCAPALAGQLAALQSHTTSNPSTPGQYAALAAYGDASDDARRQTDALVETFRRRRDLVLRLIEERLPGMPYVRPDGAFYVFLRTDGAYRDGVRDSVAFCQWLLEETGVALVPGEAFGDDRFVRLSYAAAESALEEGIDRIAAALQPELTRRT